MATATPRRLVPAAALLAALVMVGCGGAAAPSRPPGAFGFLSRATAPAGWRTASLPSGTAAIAYPRGWRPIQTDPGTFSAALLGPHRKIRGYLNATPLSGPETLANWARFRPDHNRDEGDRDVVREASAAGLRFWTGRGSCVIDRYATTASTRYREIACIVRGRRATTVVVGAAMPADWARLAPQLERSIASLTT
jgi:hypothetical protein